MGRLQFPLTSKRACWPNSMDGVKPANAVCRRVFSIRIGFRPNPLTVTATKLRRCTQEWISAVITDARILKPIVFITLSLPLAWLAFAIVQELGEPGIALGADPGEAVLHFLGDWTIRVLLLTLSVSTARRILRKSAIARYRRMVGLFAFSYALLHMLAYLGFLAEFEWQIVLEDFFERTYITVGIAAVFLLIPLALTSTHGWQRRLGRRWKRLHKLVYPIVGLGLWHLLWLTKDGYAEPLLYCAIFLGLMIERLADWRRRS